MQLNRETRRRRVMNLTPLIDVVFLLLVFFMLASTFLKFGTIKLDTVGSGDARGDIAKIALVHIGADASYRVAGRDVPVTEVSGALAKELASGKTDAVIVLRKGALTADLVAALAQVRRHGFASVRVVD